MKASMSVGISGFERWALVCLSTIEGAAETHCRVQMPLSNCRSSLDQVLCFLSPCGLSRNPTGSAASGDTSSQGPVPMRQPWVSALSSLLTCGPSHDALVTEAPLSWITKYFPLSTPKCIYGVPTVC